MRWLLLSAAWDLTGLHELGLCSCRTALLLVPRYQHATALHITLKLNSLPEDAAVRPGLRDMLALKERELSFPREVLCGILDLVAIPGLSFECCC